MCTMNKAISILMHPNDGLQCTSANVLYVVMTPSLPLKCICTSTASRVLLTMGDGDDAMCCVCNVGVNSAFVPFQASSTLSWLSQTRNPNDGKPGLLHPFITPTIATGSTLISHCRIVQPALGPFPL